MPSPGHHWWDETRRERAALWSHVVMSRCTCVANGQTRPTGSGHAGAQVCAGTASLSCRLKSHSADSRAVWLCHPAPCLYKGSSRERESLPGAYTMLPFVLGIVSAILVSDFRSRTRGYRPRRWRLPCAQTACSARNNARITSRCNVRSHALSAVARTV